MALKHQRLVDLYQQIFNLFCALASFFPLLVRIENRFVFEIIACVCLAFHIARSPFHRIDHFQRIIRSIFVDNFAIESHEFICNFIAPSHFLAFPCVQTLSGRGRSTNSVRSRPTLEHTNSFSTKFYCIRVRFENDWVREEEPIETIGTRKILIVFHFDSR